MSDLPASSPKDALVLTKLESNSRKMDSFVQLQKQRFFLTFVGLGIAITLIVLSALGGFVSYTRLSADVQDRSELVANQTACYHIVQANFVTRIGDLADSNGRQLRGEPVDVSGNIQRVQELRAAEIPMNNIQAICFIPHPDRTPLDNDPSR